MCDDAVSTCILGTYNVRGCVDMCCGVGVEGSCGVLISHVVSRCIILFHDLLGLFKDSRCINFVQY